jgi:hypothetical protein
VKCLASCCRHLLWLLDNQIQGPTGAEKGEWLMACCYLLVKGKTDQAQQVLRKVRASWPVARLLTIAVDDIGYRHSRC